MLAFVIIHDAPTPSGRMMQPHVYVIWWNETHARSGYLGAVRSGPNTDSAQSPTDRPLLDMLWGY